MKLVEILYKWLQKVDKERAQYHCRKIVQKWGKTPDIIRKSLKNSACKDVYSFNKCAKYYANRKPEKVWEEPK